MRRELKSVVIRNIDVTFSEQLPARYITSTTVRAVLGKNVMLFIS